MPQRDKGGGAGGVFVLGFSTVFVLLGASATAVGQILLGYRYQLGLVAGAIVIVFGLFLLGLVRPMWLMRERRFHIAIPGGRPLSAYVLGTAFAFGWTPCIGPILGGILTVSAASATVSGGATLLGAYSLGLGVPFVVGSARGQDHAENEDDWPRGPRPPTTAGGAMVLFGVAIITGQLTTFSYWFLEAFPSLSSIQ